MFKSKTPQEKKQSAERGQKVFVTLAVFFTSALVVQLGWNFLITELPIQIGKNFISLPKLQYSHAVVIYLLCNICFKTKTKNEAKATERLDKHEAEIEKQARTLEILKRQLFN